MFKLFTRKKKGEKATFCIDGMHCTSCVMNIDGELEDIDGVFSALTSYAKAQTIVTFDPVKVSKSQLIAAIKNAGYSATEQG